jgi:glycosyltransferase involved in cell wall biosynthesis
MAGRASSGSSLANAGREPVANSPLSARVSREEGHEARRDAKVTIGIPTRNRSRWLREAVASALAQTYGGFELVISDNASTDDTASVVAALDDPRVTYHRSDVDIGMFGNLNRVIELAKTEYVVVLPDDDLLYPDYLDTVLGVHVDNRALSVVHSAFDLIDENGRMLDHGRMLLPSKDEVSLETGPQLIERSMRASGTVCWTSACFRTAAVVAAGGMRAEDEPYADGSLMMRIALHGDFSCVSRPLVAVRVHAGAESASVGALAGTGYRPADDAPRFLYRQRLQFLDEARLPPRRDRRYRALARRAFRRGTVGQLTLELRSGDLTSTEALHRLLRLGRGDPQLFVSRATVKLVAAILHGVVSRPRP